MSKIIFRRILYSKKIFLKYIVLNNVFLHNLLFILTPFGLGLKYIPKMIELKFNSYKFNNTLSIIYKKKYQFINQNTYSFLGLYWILIKQYIQDYTKIYVIDIEFRGMGYKGLLELTNHNQYFRLYLGFTHIILYILPLYIKVSVPPSVMTNKFKRYLLFSCSRQYLLEILFYLKSLKGRDSYKGKGIFFFKEFIKLKEGKQQKH